VSTRVIVPHRGLEAAKTRLASVLSPAERGELAADLLRRVLRTVREAVTDVVVISPSPALADLVEPLGARLVVQRGMGLNAGLDQARTEALADRIGALAVLHGDLPDLRVADVRALLRAVPQPRGVAIAPDAAGTGTNGLAMRPADAIPFRFGAGSGVAHREEAARAGIRLAIVDRPGLAFDLDTPEDLAQWLARGDAA